MGPSFIKKTRDPTRNPAQIKTQYPKIAKIPYIYRYIYTYNLTLIPHFSSTTIELSSLPASVRHSLSLISTQSHTPTLPHLHSHTPSCLPPSLPPSVRHSLSLSSVTPTHPQFDTGTNLFKTLTHHLRQFRLFLSLNSQP